jgi:hypothetical protein
MDQAYHGCNTPHDLTRRRDIALRHVLFHAIILLPLDIATLHGMYVGNYV